MANTLLEVGRWSEVTATESCGLETPGHLARSFHDDISAGDLQAAQNRHYAGNHVGLESVVSWVRAAWTISL
jgi:hypothetical protein